ncbi:MAG: carbohydrate kinase family protein [Promethearchaeota archaeon]|jgi:sugar/nucleoside kinase (ribokinase family)
MCPDIISLGELLVEIMRLEINTPHSVIGANYRGPFPSGAPAIFINSAARMSKPFHFTTGFIGVVGADEFGKCILSKLGQDGVDISKIRSLKTKSTGIAFNQYNSDGTRKFIFAPGAAGELSSGDIEKTYLSDIKVLHIMGSSLSITEKSREACYRAQVMAREENSEVIISFDPNLRPEMLELEEILEICKPVLRNTDILLPSGKEAEMLAEIDGPINACQKLLKNGPKIVVLKQGSEGCTVFTQEFSNGIKIKGFNVDEIDPTGAGDSFGGAFIVGFLAGWDLKKVGIFANAVGALKVKSFGPMPTTTYEQVTQFIEAIKY